MSNRDSEIALATSYGATARPDKNRGHGWCLYNLYGWTIWQIREGGWQCARLKNGRYFDHSPKGTLVEALEFACQIQGMEL